MKGEGVSGGALTVINAIAGGLGSAFGIGLSTRAAVSPRSDGEVTLTINGEPADAQFASCLLAELRRVRPSDDIAGADISAVSDIPQSMGLKSSSAAANAILLAADAAYSLGLTEKEILLLGAKASIAAKISITGAYDDAAACLLGGLVFTDNKNMRLLRRTLMPDEYAVVILPGTFTVPTCSFPKERLDAKASAEAFAAAMRGKVFSAMRENGRLVSEALCISTEPADRAIAAGAAAAGLSGTGPATGILVLQERLDGFLARFGEENCIITGIRNGRLT